MIVEQVHMLPQGQNGHLFAPSSAKLNADITIYHPLAHTMFGSLFNIYMTMRWFISSRIILCSRMQAAQYAVSHDSILANIISCSHRWKSTLKGDAFGVFDEIGGNYLYNKKRMQ